MRFYPSFLSIGATFAVVVIWFKARVLYKDGNEAATVDTRHASDGTADIATFADGLSDSFGVVWHAIMPWGAVVGWPSIAFDESLKFAVDATSVSVSVAIDSLKDSLSKKFSAGLVWVNIIASKIKTWVLIYGLGPVGDDDVGIIFCEFFKMSIIGIVSGVFAGIIGDKNNIMFCSEEIDYFVDSSSGKIWRIGAKCKDDGLFESIFAVLDDLDTFAPGATDASINVASGEVWEFFEECVLSANGNRIADNGDIFAGFFGGGTISDRGAFTGVFIEKFLCKIATSFGTLVELTGVR